MKILILCIAISLVAITAFGQNTHLKFKGVEICGTLEDFIIKYKELNNNSRLLEIHGSQAALKDTFCGEDGLIRFDSNSETGMYGIMYESLEPHTYWSALCSEYSKFFYLFSEKYGKPSDSANRFTGPYRNGNHVDYEIVAIKNGHCVYFSKWELSNGEIRMTIDDDCKVRIYYIDKIGFDKHSNLNKQKFKNEI